MSIPARRVRLAEPLGTAFFSGNSSGRGVLQNVSLGGIFVKSPMLLKRGSWVEARFTTSTGKRLAVVGRVRWNTAVAVAGVPVTSGFGVHLDEPGSEYLEFVSCELSASVPARS